MNESIVQGQGVLISMGFVVLQNGTVLPNPEPDWFDYIMIHDPSASAAAFVVSGYRYTPVGAASPLRSFYDAELVFGGGGNGEVTQFEQFSATLGLLYCSSAADNYTAFPSYYSFGAYTAEATTDLHVAYLGAGFGSLSVGAPDYVYLGPSAPQTTTTTATTATSTGAGTTPTSSPTQSTSTQTPTKQPSSSSSSSCPTTPTASATGSQPPTSSTASSGSAAAGLAFIAVIVVAAGG
jgi:thermopsin